MRDEARLAFIVRFAQQELHGLSRQEWTQLTTDVSAFLQDNNVRLGEHSPHPWTLVTGFHLDGSRAQLLTREGIADLQQRTQRLLRDALHDDLSLVGVLPRVVRLPYSTRKTPTAVTLMRGSTRWFVMVNSEAREAFLFGVMVLLARGGEARLRLCPACDAIFVRKRRQTYCSARCKNRTNISKQRAVWRTLRNA